MSSSTLPDVGGFSPPVNVLPFHVISPEDNVRTSVQERVLSLRPATASPSTTIRALHLVNGEHYSGAERVQDLLARQLPQLGCEVGFVCVKPRRFPAAREAKEAPLVEMPMRGRFDLRAVKRIVRLIHSERYDLIHAHTPRTALIGRLAASAPACHSFITSIVRPAVIRPGDCSTR
jgi:hypothetical protein